MAITYAGERRYISAQAKVGAGIIDSVFAGENAIHEPDAWRVFNGWNQIAPARTITKLGYTATLTSGSNIAALSVGATAKADFRFAQHVLIGCRLYVIELIPGNTQLRISPTADARRAVYERSFKPQAMERVGKLSSGSVRVKRQIEALRGDAYVALRSMPEYRTLSAKDQKSVRELINEELERFKATASSVSRGGFRREKRARVPDWTPAELAKAAVEARQ
jgi:hypothetical protein